MANPTSGSHGGGKQPCSGSGNWFYNEHSGVMNRVPSGPLQLPYITALGWHKLKISYCATRQEAIAEAEKEFPHGATPGGGLVHNVTQQAASGISSGVLGPLFQANIWLRVGEVALGLLLIAIGVAKLTNAVPVATQVAKVVAK